MSGDQGSVPGGGNAGRSHGESGTGSFLSGWEQTALSVASIAICTFAAVVSVVVLFTKDTIEALVVSGISLAVVLVGIVGIYRARIILRHGVRVPVYLLLLVVIAMLAAGFAIRSLLAATPRPDSPTASPSASVSSTGPPASSPTPDNSPGASSPPVSLSAPDGDIVAIPAAFSQDGDLIAGGGNRDSTDVYAWNARTGMFIGPLALGGSFSLEALAFTPDDKSLMVLDAAGGVCKWNLSGTRCTPVLADPGWYNGDPWNSAISSDTSTVAFQDPAGTGVDVVSLATGRQVAHFTDPDGAPLAGADYTGSDVPGSDVSLDKDGRVLAVGDARGNIYVWDVPANQLLARFRFNPAATLNDSAPVATISPDGQTILVPDAGTGLQSTLWNVSTRADVTPADTRWPRTWDKGNGSVFFTSDGQGIITFRDGGGGTDLWNAVTRAHIASEVFTGRYAGMGLEVYAASGQEILADDGTSRAFLWRIP